MKKLTLDTIKNQLERTASKKIGIKSTIYILNLALLIAFVLFYLLSGGEGIGTIQLYPISFIFTIIGLYFGGYIFGGIAGKSIQNKSVHPILMGIITTISTIFIGALTGFTISYIIYAYNPENEQLNAIIELIINPTMGVIVIGFIPSLIFGTMLGKRIEKKLNPTSTKTSNDRSIPS